MYEIPDDYQPLQKADTEHLVRASKGPTKKEDCEVLYTIAFVITAIMLIQLLCVNMGGLDPLEMISHLSYVGLDDKFNSQLKSCPLSIFENFNLPPEYIIPDE